ncbi:MAG: hypothetical protein H7A37_02035 [Chlamydiales bacterium]|nr:hypothetical protein [Chlamydiia bacterium]MCP5507070.1 hypothetical protein [Chlamydiales bacterium]
MFSFPVCLSEKHQNYVVLDCGSNHHAYADCAERRYGQVDKKGTLKVDPGNHECPKCHQVVKGYSPDSEFTDLDITHLSLMGQRVSEVTAVIVKSRVIAEDGDESHNIETNNSDTLLWNGITHYMPLASIDGDGPEFHFINSPISWKD